jgi:hypothetical protein
MLTNTPVGIIWNPPVQVTASDLAAEISASLSNLVSNDEQIPDNDLLFIQKPYKDLEQFLLSSILPEVNKFKRSLGKFYFKSPLNFIMVEEDFNKFY